MIGGLETLDACVILVVFSGVRTASEFAYFERRELSEKSRVQNCLATGWEGDELQVGATADIADRRSKMRIRTELANAADGFEAEEGNSELWKYLWKRLCGKRGRCQYNDALGLNLEHQIQLNREPAGKQPRKPMGSQIASQIALGKGDTRNEKDLSAKSSASRQTTRISQEDVA